MDLVVSILHKMYSIQRRLIHKKPIPFLNMATCTQSMQRTWWSVTSTTIVTVSYWMISDWNSMKMQIFKLNEKSLKSQASRLFAQSFVQVWIKENIKAPRHRPLWGESTGDRWIPLTKGQQRGKCFLLMTSSCHKLCVLMKSMKNDRLSFTTRSLWT